MSFMKEKTLNERAEDLITRLESIVNRQEDFCTPACPAIAHEHEPTLESKTAETLKELVEENLRITEELAPPF